MDSANIPTTEKRAEYRKEFIKSFVESFETRLDNYEEELQNKKTKTGTTAGASGGIGSAIGGAAGSLLGVSGPGSAVGRKVANLIGNYVGSKTHKNKAGKINEFIHPYRDEDFRRLIIKAVSVCFGCYECQFMKVSYTGGWSVGLNRLAEEAVDRLINYINDLADVNDVIFSVDFITQGIVLGKSKEYIKNKILKNKIQFNSIECKIANIYNKVGLKITQNDSTSKYYRKRHNESHTDKYGHRLPFNWELEKLDKIIENYVEEDCPKEIFIYTDQSETELLEEVNNILKDVNKTDPLLVSDIIQSEIRKTHEENRSTLNLMNQKYNEVVNNLEKVHVQTTFIQEALKLSLSKADKTVSIWFDMINPVRAFTGRTTELDDLHSALQSEKRQMVISQTAAISGLGGIGKSELARKYAETFSSYYENVVWISSETQESLKESFQKLARELDIPTVEKVDLNSYQERNIIFVVKDVYRRLRNSESLFIFDNAEDYVDIKHFLPVNLSPQDKKPYLLITSRNCNWRLGEEGRVEVLPLKDFEVGEAIEFIKTALEINHSDYDHDIKELVEMLFCFPLALQQAQACIQEKNLELKLKSDGTFSIRDYITEYRNTSKRSEFLNFSTKHGNDRYVRTVYTTLIITLDNLKHKLNGTSALLIVEILAYFASDRISVEKIFSKLLKGKDLWASVELLAKYSIINITRGFASIHRLVQEVIRLELVKREREISVLRQALKVINRTVYVIEDDITHFISVWKHTVNHDKLINEFFFRFIYGKGKNNILHLLAESGETTVTKKILSKLKAKYSHKLQGILNETDQYGRSPLYMAVENNHLETAIVLRNEGANVDIPSNIAYDSLSTRRTSAWTPLHIASYKGFVEIVSFLVNSGANTNLTDSLQRKPIDLAVDAGHLKIVQILNPSGYDHLLHTAVRNGKLRDVKLLYEKGVNLNARLANWTALHIAAFSGYLEIVKFLVENGAIVDDSSDDGFTPLHAAASSGHLPTIKYLVSKINYDISDIRNEDGWALIHAAAQNGHLDVVKFLIEDMKQDKNMTDKKGTTPLQTAAFHGKPHVVEYLLSQNVNVNAEDVVGSNILTSAAVNYHTEVIKLLLTRKDLRISNTPINERTLFGRLNFTVLHFLAAYDGLEVFRDLIEKHNMDGNVGENISLTPLHVATLFNCINVMNYLIDTGVNIDIKINVSNAIDVFIEIVNDSAIVNSSMKTVVSVLFNFVKYFRFGSLCSFLLTPANIHRGLGYNPHPALNKHSRWYCWCILRIFFNLKPIKTHISYVKSYMDDKKYKNSYSETDADYFIAKVIDGDQKFTTDTTKLKYILYIVIFFFVSIVIIQTNVLPSICDFILR